jgi:hypothetical protein
LDIDKISRLANFCNTSLSAFDLATSAKLTNIALDISISQIMTLVVEQTSNYTSGSAIYFTFTISTIIDSKPTSASLHCYVIANGNFDMLSCSSNNGVGSITVQVPLGSAESALLLIFARSSFDDRLTSYCVYNFADSMQVAVPSQSLQTPKDYTLNFSANSSVVNQNGFVFSYSTKQALAYTRGTVQCQFPSLVDNSPMVIVMCGLENGLPVEEWTAYPQVPLKAGVNFAGQEQNVFSYIVTVNGVLYRLDLSLGDLPS